MCLVATCFRHIGKNGYFLVTSLGFIYYVLTKNNEWFVLSFLFNSGFYHQSSEIMKVRDRTFRSFQRKWFKVILWGTWAWRNLSSSHREWGVPSGQGPAPTSATPPDAAQSSSSYFGVIYVLSSFVKLYLKRIPLPKKI